jgi:hypothetical protein
MSPRRTAGDAARGNGASWACPGCVRSSLAEPIQVRSWPPWYGGRVINRVHRIQLTLDTNPHPNLDPWAWGRSNVYPYDEQLVLLRGRGGYINASHVTVAAAGGGTGSYVVAQAPMHPDSHGPDTTAAFWRLVWEQNVHTIVALALVEVLLGTRSLASWASSLAVRNVYLSCWEAFCGAWAGLAWAPAARAGFRWAILGLYWAKSPNFLSSAKCRPKLRQYRSKPAAPLLPISSAEHPRRE